MSRELDRRIAALERIKNGQGVEYVVLDYAPEDDEREPYRLRPPMTEEQWEATYCFD
ncbi:hypothetical protein [Bosea sp. 47.2.35]|uniref:hypothetical protein n=1 Tax=Bosea sp. 47.2.35 TaxID=2969304 RepID=UPI00214FAB04|nr:hypothetical protein [Bosea sp. 47.2.35]MCR4524652.1 hypothetical protein [Bosea sp. 47.2.35]